MKKSLSRDTSSSGRARQTFRSLRHLLSPVGQRMVLRYMASPFLAALLGLTATTASAQIPAVPLDTDFTVGTGEMAMVYNFHTNENDPTKTITLDGGELGLNSILATPDYDAATNSYHFYSLGTIGTYVSDKIPDPETYSWNQLGLNASRCVETSLHQFAWGENGGTIYCYTRHNAAADTYHPYATYYTYDGTDYNPIYVTADTFDKISEENTLYESDPSVTINNAVNYNGGEIGALTVLGDGAITICADQGTTNLDTNTTTYAGKNRFSDVTVSSGQCLSVYGSNAYSGTVMVLMSTMVSADGRQSFNDLKVWGGEMVVDGSNTLRKCICPDGENTGTLINGNVDVMLGTLMMYGKVDYAADSNTNVQFGTLVGNSESFDTSINLSDSMSHLYLGDFDTKSNFMKNLWYVTRDENQKPTAIEWEAARANIESVVTADNVHSGALTGSGNVFINSYHPTTESGAASYNGYTVVMDDGKEEFAGFTYVTAGTLALKGGMTYGTAASMFDIYGESYSEVRDKNGNICLDENGRQIYNVDSCGMLAFYRGDETNPDVAPVLNAGTFALENGKDDGARLWLDASLKDASGNFDASTARNLGTVNTNFAVIGEKTQVWYDRVSRLNKDTEMTFKLNARGIFTSQTSDPLVGKDAKAAYLGGIFGQAQLVDASYNPGTGVVTARAVDVAEFAAENGMSEDEQKYASFIDTNRQDGTNGREDFYDSLYNTSNADDVRQTIHNLSIGSGIENMTMMTGHMGNPGSVFFGGGMTSMGGMTTRGQEENDTSVNPAEAGTAQRDVINYSPNQNRWTGWVSYSHTSINGYGYDQGGMHKDGYNVRRTGLLVGLRQQLSDTFSAGLLFAYSSPELNQNGQFKDGSADRYASNIDMDDYQFALHFEKQFGHNWEFCAFVGGGAQSMDWQRNLNLSGMPYSFTGDTTGNTLTATAYLIKRLQMTETFSICPTIGFDTEHTWMFGFKESGTEMDDHASLMSATASCYTYDRMAYSRQTLRLGVSSAKQSASGMAGMSGRLFYGRQLSSEDAATIHVSNDTFKKGFDVEGNAMGRDSLNMGLGIYGYLNELKTLSVSADYNAVLYENAATQNVTAGLQWRF